MGDGRLERAHSLRRRAETHLVSAGWLSARELLDDALRLYRQEADPAGEAVCLRGLGDVALKLDEADVAAASYSQALAIGRSTGDLASQAECVMRLGELARSSGDLRGAGGHLEEAQRLFAELGDVRGEAQCLGLRGEIARMSGAPIGESLALFRQAIRLQMAAGDLRSSAVTLTFMGNLLKDSDATRAAEAFAQAGRIYSELGLHHRADPFVAAARRLDPSSVPEPQPRPAGPWDADD